MGAAGDAARLLGARADGPGPARLGRAWSLSSWSGGGPWSRAGGSGSTNIYIYITAVT